MPLTRHLAPVPDVDTTDADLRGGPGSSQIRWPAPWSPPELIVRLTRLYQKRPGRLYQYSSSY